MQCLHKLEEGSHPSYTWLLFKFRSRSVRPPPWLPLLVLRFFGSLSLILQSGQQGNRKHCRWGEGQQQAEMRTASTHGSLSCTACSEEDVTLFGAPPTSRVVGTKAELPTRVLANIWEVSPCLRLKNQVPPLIPQLSPKKPKWELKRYRFYLISLEDEHK